MNSSLLLPLIGVPLFALCAVMAFLCRKAFVLWHTHRDETQAWAAQWSFLAAVFVASRAIQRVFYTEDAAVWLGVYGQFVSAVLLLPYSILVTRAMGRVPTSPDFKRRLAYGTLGCIAVTVGFGVKGDLYTRYDLLGLPLRSAQARWPVLGLVPLIAFCLLEVTKSLRVSRPDGGLGPMNIVAGLAMFVLALNDALLGAGVIRSVQLAHFALVIAALQAGFVQTANNYAQQVQLSDALAARTKDLERVLDELRRRESRLQLADRMTALGTLAAGAAHEINNPLACAMLNLEFVDHRLRDIEGQAQGVGKLRELIGDSRDACDRIARIVRDLQTLTQRDHESNAAVDLAKVARWAAKVAHHEIRFRARLVEQYDPAPPVLGSEARLGQVCLNLLINAAHAILPGDCESNEVGLRIRTETDSVVLEVTDTGTGIDPAILPRIFDPFFTTKEVGLGTGLGLSICHTIVSGLGGRIVVESRMGAGSTFRVTVPAAPDAARTAPGSGPAVRAPAGGSILIVDDEPALARSLARGLDGWHATFADGADAAIALLERRTFDVVLCDLMMPGKDGMDVHEFVRRSKPELLERFVLMTGATLPEHAQESLRRTSTRCVRKPLSFQTLRAVVVEIDSASARALAEG